MRSYVYAIKSGAYVKIGYTQHIQARLADIRARRLCNPPADLEPTEPTEIVGYLSGDRDVERAIQQAFERFRATGEWFHWTPEIETWCALRNQWRSPSAVIDF